MLAQTMSDESSRYTFRPNGGISSDLISFETLLTGNNGAEMKSARNRTIFRCYTVELQLPINFEENFLIAQKMK